MLTSTTTGPLVSRICSGCFLLVGIDLLGVDWFSIEMRRANDQHLSFVHDKDSSNLRSCFDRCDNRLASNVNHNNNDKNHNQIP